MPCAFGLFSIKTTKSYDTHMMKLNIFEWEIEVREKPSLQG